jgi:hypothetical protein
MREWMFYQLEKLDRTYRIDVFKNPEDPRGAVHSTSSCQGQPSKGSSLCDKRASERRPQMLEGGDKVSLPGAFCESQLTPPWCRAATSILSSRAVRMT